MAAIVLPNNAALLLVFKLLLMVVAAALQTVHWLVAIPLTSSLRQFGHACTLIVLVLLLDTDYTVVLLLIFLCYIINCF